MNNQQLITELTTDVHNYQQPEAYYQMEIVKAKLDLNYLKTLPGMLKCICIVSIFILKNFFFLVITLLKDLFSF